MTLERFAQPAEPVEVGRHTQRAAVTRPDEEGLPQRREPDLGHLGPPDLHATAAESGLGDAAVVDPDPGEQDRDQHRRRKHEGAPEHQGVGHHEP